LQLSLAYAIERWYCTTIFIHYLGVGQKRLPLAAGISVLIIKLDRVPVPNL